MIAIVGLALFLGLFVMSAFERPNRDELG